MGNLSTLSVWSNSSQYSSISGTTWAGTGTIEEKPLKEDDEIEITLLDDTKVIITLKEYFSFIAYNKMVPSDCKNKKEFNEKMMVFRI